MTTLKTPAKETNLNFTANIDVTLRLHACMQKIVYLEERMYFINQLQGTNSTCYMLTKALNIFYFTLHEKLQSGSLTFYKIT